MPTMWHNLGEYFDTVGGAYKRTPWQDQEEKVGIVLEKDALRGVVEPITWEFRVPLFPVRGFSSRAFLANDVEPYIEEGMTIYAFGDNDPSGQDTPRDVEARLRALCDCDFDFKRVALTPEQVKLHRLPTRPTKKSDPRAGSFKGRSVELDALPPDVLRALVRRCIERHINPEAWARSAEIEHEEIRAAQRFVRRWKGGSR